MVRIDIKYTEARFSLYDKAARIMATMVKIELDSVKIEPLKSKILIGISSIKLPIIIAVTILFILSSDLSLK